MRRFVLLLKLMLLVACTSELNEPVMESQQTESDVSPTMTAEGAETAVSMPRET
jgi:uncharacterized protein YcfL